MERARHRLLEKVVFPAENHRIHQIGRSQPGIVWVGGLTSFRRQFVRQMKVSRDQGLCQEVIIGSSRYLAVTTEPPSIEGKVDAGKDDN